MVQDGGSRDVPADVELRVAIRRLRRERGLSQRDLCRPLHLASHSLIADWEAGRRLPSAAVLAGYERHFGLPPMDLQVLRQRALAERAVAEADVHVAPASAPLVQRPRRPL